MSRKYLDPIAGRDYTLLSNGAMVVGRQFPNLLAPYEPERIPNYLSAVNHSLRVGKRHYEHRLLDAENDLRKLVYGKLQKSKRTLIIVAQGRDGAGKTGARKRVEEAMHFDAKNFLPIAIVKPSPEEFDHGYLWRFYKGERMPAWGQVRFFDRSWLERVLVERVKKLDEQEKLENSYAEIRGFEWLLRQQGAILVKFWMDITKDEQKRRFDDRAREASEKLSEDDFEARKAWPQYTRFANEMLYRIGTDFAPFYVISSQDKRYSRVTFLEIINQVLSRELT